jgi:hypothetical protein
MNATRPYEPELTESLVKFELPFSVRLGHESAAEFKERADRDGQIIRMFVTRFVVQSKKTKATKLEVEVLVNTAEIRVTNSAAYFRGTGVRTEVSEVVIESLYEECIGNLPIEYRNGGLNSTKDVVIPKTSKPKARVYVQPLLTKIDYGKPIVLIVPNPN